MSDHTWLEHTAPYALGALDEQERVSFEAHLATCDVCTAEVRELREVAGLLATSVAPLTPPPRLRERILSNARQVRPIATASVPAPNSSSGQTERGVRPSRRGVLLPWFVAAAAGLAAAVFGLQIRGERAARVAAERSLASTLVAMDSTKLSLWQRDSLIATLVSPDVQAVSVSGTGPAPSARYFLDRRASRIIIAANALPPAAPGRTYQLWGIETGRPPVSLGTFNTDMSGRVLATLTLPAGLRIGVTAVTDEPMGGSPQPTTTPFLAATWKAE